MSEHQIQVIDSHVPAGDETARDGSKFCTRPSLARRGDGSFLFATLVGSQKTGPDSRIRVLESTDDCATWRVLPSPTVWDERANAGWGYMMCHLTETAPGRLLAAYLRTDRFNPAEDLFHPETNGMQLGVVRLSESPDNGQTWSEPWDLDYKLPDLIAPGPFLRLPDGALGMPFEVWHEWDKGWRQGPSTRLIISHDNGKTWPEAGIIARDETRKHIYGDPRLTTLPDGKLVVLLWVYNIETQEDLPGHRSVSSDNGRTWSVPESVGLTSQIANPAALREGLMLGVYQRRFGGEAGLRAVLSYDDGLTWDAETDVAIWAQGHHTDDKNPFSGYQEYTFGNSTIVKLTDREVLVPFWVSNGNTTYMRILRVEVV